MLADDLEYGWYKWEDGCRQSDGFFVDRFGRVIFWPGAKGPGYVLDDATAERIGGRKKREIEEKKEEEAGAEIGGFMAAVVGGLIKVGVPAMPIFIVALVFKVIVFFAKKASTSSDGDPVSNEETAVPKDAPEAEESDEADLSRCRQVAGPRPDVWDDLIVTKAIPAFSFWMGRIWASAFAVGALWLFGLLARDWTWNSVGDICWGIVFGLLLLLIAVGCIGGIYAKIRLRYSPLTLGDLMSRIKVRDGLTPRKLMFDEDQEDPPEYLQPGNRPEFPKGPYYG
jgi:hypothetical protein